MERRLAGQADASSRDGSQWHGRQTSTHAHTHAHTAARTHLRTPGGKDGTQTQGRRVCGHVGQARTQARQAVRHEHTHARRPGRQSGTNTHARRPGSLAGRHTGTQTRQAVRHVRTHERTHAARDEGMQPGSQAQAVHGRQVHRYASNSCTYACMHAMHTCRHASG